MALYNENGEMNIFGYTLFKKDAKSVEPDMKSFVPVANDSGGTETYTTSGAAYNSYSVDIDPSAFKTEYELIQKYREMSLVSEIDMAVSEITDEFIVVSEDEPAIILDFNDDFLEKSTYSKKTKSSIINEFNTIVRLLKFNQNGHDIFRNFYVDGRTAYHKVVDTNNLKLGIQELRPIDVIKLKKVIEITKERDQNTNTDIIKGQHQYYVFSENGFSGDTKTGLKISYDAIAYVTSGLLDRNNNLSLSYLHKAIRPLNQLRMMEDSDVIYRMTRAPERRVFYIDTSGMARTKAEQYVKDVMARYKNKQVYDVNTGTVTDSKKHLSILEDFWMPRSSGGKGTEITTLQSGGSLGNLENTEYFQTKLYQSLGLPLSRLQPGQGMFSIGNNGSITRDEIKFTKFIMKLRRRFNLLFLDLLKTQLILKCITTADDWEELKENLVFKYSKDNFFAELKESDMLRDRLGNVNMAEPYVGKYFSERHIMRNILKMTDSECELMEKQIQEDVIKNTPPEPPPEEQQPAPAQPEQNPDQAQPEQQPEQQSQAPDDNTAEPPQGQ